MRYLLFLVFTAAFVAVVACARSAANEATNAAPVANPASAVSNAEAAPTPIPNEEVPRISLADAKKAFDDGTGFFVDARAEPAYKDEHVKGAINITGDKLDERLKDLPKNKKIIVYCS